MSKQLYDYAEDWFAQYEVLRPWKILRRAEKQTFRAQSLTADNFPVVPPLSFAPISVVAQPNQKPTNPATIPTHHDADAGNVSGNDRIQAQDDEVVVSSRSDTSFGLVETDPIALG
jgi:hypothetical protein